MTTQAPNQAPALAPSIKLKTIIAWTMVVGSLLAAGVFAFYVHVENNKRDKQIGLTEISKGLTETSKGLAEMSDANLEKHIAQALKEERVEFKQLGEHLQPARIVDGSKVVLLFQRKAYFNSRMSRVSANKTSLGRTTNGTYVLIDYSFTFGTPADCIPLSKCFPSLNIREILTADQAKQWLFDEPSATPEDYTRIFGESMPVRKVDA